jgi:small ligand-binding sensory domain FIST
MMAKADGNRRFGSALSTLADCQAAAAEVCEGVQRQLSGSPDLVLLFSSVHRLDSFGSLLEEVTGRLRPGTLLGCTGESIVGRGTEIEDGPALSLWAGIFPRARLRSMHLETAATPEGPTLVGWPDDLPETWPDGSLLLVLGDPYSFPADALLGRLNEDQPGVRAVGGMASGGNLPGEIRLFLDGREIQGGAVAALLSGDVGARTVVSQGCRPIGGPLVITKAERNLILELGGKPPLVQLREIFETLPPQDQTLIQKGLHVGRVINEYQERFSRGDFLIRNVIGADPRSGSVAVGDLMRPGQTVQFHVRDQRTADEDLCELLRQARDSGPAAALLFTCNGRGTRLFDEPHHDASAIDRELGGLPLGGFFAQGEIGPVGGRNFLHGFTASVLLFH